MIERTIACNYQKLIIIAEFMDSHVGVSGHNLLFRRQFGTSLEFEVAKGPRQGQVTVDTAKVDETTCSADTSLLAYSSNPRIRIKKLKKLDLRREEV